MIDFIMASIPPTRAHGFRRAETAAAHSARAFIDTTLGGQSLRACLGQTITNAVWSNAAFRLHMANDLSLTLRLYAHEVDASLAPAREASDLGESTFADKVAMCLDAQIFVWRRGTLMRALIGKRLTRLHLCGNDTLNLIYVEDIGALLLCGLIAGEAQRRFLFWSPAG